MIQSDFGVVLLKEWVNNPKTGQEVRAIVGPITLRTAKEDFGFIPKGNETNWAVEVGSKDKGQLLILGCQIRAIYYGEKFKPPGVNSWVLE